MLELKIAVHTTMAHVPTTSPTISRILAKALGKAVPQAT